MPTMTLGVPLPHRVCVCSISPLRSLCHMAALSAFAVLSDDKCLVAVWPVRRLCVSLFRAASDLLHALVQSEPVFAAVTGSGPRNLRGVLTPLAASLVTLLGCGVAAVPDADLACTWLSANAPMLSSLNPCVLMRAYPCVCVCVCVCVAVCVCSRGVASASARGPWHRRRV